MKIEMLKNKNTNVIEKLIINNKEGINFKDISILGLKHEETLITLSPLEIKWHEIFMNYNINSNIIYIKTELYKDFNLREANFIFDAVSEYHKKHFNHNIDFNEYDRWYFNYYMWTIFNIIVSNKTKLNIETIDKKDNEIKIVDPVILFLIDGIEYCKKTNLFRYFDSNNKVLSIIWNMSLTEDKDLVFKKLKELNYNNEDINLFMFEKEILNISDLNNKNKLLWNLKKEVISKILFDFIQEKIHYSL